MTECMERIAARDAKALEALYDRYSRVLYAVILSIVKRKEDAEEILGDIFFQVWEKAGSYDGGKGSVYGWLLALARNRSIDRLRSKGYKQGRQEDSETGEMDGFVNNGLDNPLDKAELSQRMERVKAAMEKISPDQRRVIESAYFEGWSQSEVAERLGLPLGTVKTRMRDGMKHLQTMLRDLL
jgi:RNA polymerase sigma-70 factor (ECF subfamily)